MFRERQLLIRDGDGVRTLRLTPRRQALAAAAGGIAVGIVLAGLGTLTWQNAALHDRAATLAQVRDTRGVLAERIDAAVAHARTLDRNLPAVAPAGVGRPLTPRADDLAALKGVVHRIAERRARLDRRLANVRARHDRAETQLARLQRRETDLEAELTETRDTLRATSSGRENLGDRLAQTLAELHRVRARYQAAAAERRAAEAKLAELSGDLETVRAGRTALRKKVADVTETLSRTRSQRDELLAEREKLASRVGRLEETLGHVAEAGKTDLIARIGDLRESLVAAERKTKSYRKRNAQLSQKVTALQKRLETVQETQSGLFSHYTTQARNSLAAIEKTVAMTGLDVDTLVKKARKDRQNLGGPFVPASGFPDSVGHSAQKLDRQMQRLRILQNVLGRLPLTPPLDSYWVSSHFGKRRDPYNGRWAMHEGIDLAGQPGLTVHAAAPGKVVHAGWKGGYGRMVAIAHGYGIVSRYAHLKKITVEEGQSVEHRGALGKLGNTGRSTGPHVHYEIRVEGEPADPMNFLKAGKYAFKK